MLSSQNPAKIPIAWAVNGLRRAIPAPSQAGITPGAASWNDGFPSPCFQDLSAGGIPPDGNDMNGGLYAISVGLQWLQAYGINGFDAAFAAAIGGYPLWAIIRSLGDPNVLFISNSENNYADPGTTGAGAWTKYVLPGFTTVQQGGGAGQSTNKVYIGWSGSGLKAQVDASDLGTFMFSSLAYSSFAQKFVSSSHVLTTTWPTPAPGTSHDTVLSFTMPGDGFILATSSINHAAPQPGGGTHHLYLNGVDQNAPATSISSTIPWASGLVAGATGVTLVSRYDTSATPTGPLQPFGNSLAFIVVAQ